jgi:transcription elongation factor Elf1
MTLVSISADFLPGGTCDKAFTVFVNYTSCPTGHNCPVCGYAKLAEPLLHKTGCASIEICPSCGTEFGVRRCQQIARRATEALVGRWRTLA